MKRDYALETQNRIAFIREKVQSAGANGVILGNSGGKDSALVGILCKMACDQTVSVIMPCQSKRNYGEDTDDAWILSKQFDIETITVDLSDTKSALMSALGQAQVVVSDGASTNIAPRLRMTALYAIAGSRNLLVAGTGNRSERVMGYFTKFGDGGFDFNPIADLTATEVFEFLAYLHAPENIIKKAPSAGLYEGQTDEQEMGLTYRDLDTFIQEGTGAPETIEKIERAYARSAHKRSMPSIYADAQDPLKRP